jgi:inosose dehydratase
VQKYDERIGLCIDVGHTARTGVDPAESIKRCAGRLYDVHLKDIATSEVGSKSRPVEVGRGVLNIHKILGNLLDIKFRGLVGLKYEKDMNDPLAGVAESIGYVRGVLSEIRESRGPPPIAYRPNPPGRRCLVANFAPHEALRREDRP